MLVRFVPFIWMAAFVFPLLTQSSNAQNIDVLPQPASRERRPK